MRRGGFHELARTRNRQIGVLWTRDWDGRRGFAFTREYVIVAAGRFWVQLRYGISSGVTVCAGRVDA